MPDTHLPLHWIICSKRGEIWFINKAPSKSGEEGCIFTVTSWSLGHIRANWNHDTYIGCLWPQLLLLTMAVLRKLFSSNARKGNLGSIKVVMYGCESWPIKKAEHQRIDAFELCVVLEKTLESPLDCKEIQVGHPKGDQSWVFISRTNVEAETPILWPPHAKS